MAPRRRRRPAARSRCPRSSRSPTNPPTTSCSSGSSRVARPRPDTGERLRPAPRPTARGRRPVLRARGPPDHREPRAARTSRHRRGPSSTPTHRLLPLARLARDAARLPRRAIAGLERLAGAARRVRWRRRAAGAAARRPLGREPSRRRRRSALADRSRGARRPPRVRPGDDAPVRRLRAGVLRRVRRRSRRSPPGWAERVALHQIAPLVVHAIKFGGGYVRRPTDAIARYA